MAADDAGERTEEPTARRVQEAREEGRIPRSTDLAAATALLGGLLLLRAFGRSMLQALLELTRGIGDTPDLDAESALPWLALVFQRGARVVLPFVALLVVITVAGSALQSGLPFSFKRLKPRLDQLNPMVGIRRVASLDSLTRLGLGVLKMIFVATIAYWAIAGDIQQALSLGTLEPAAALGAGASVVYRLALRIGLALFVLALLDYFYQRWNWWRNLKMTKQEVRDELKRMEGDPQIRGRRRRMQLQLAMQRLSAEVPKADVVVTNPTEYAVALRYDEATMGAPRVIAKGVDFLALRIRQIAQQSGIPVVQRPPLARALYAAVEIGQEVPPMFYRAVAELLAYVYQLTGRTRETRRAGVPA